MNAEWQAYRVTFGQKYSVERIGIIATNAVQEAAAAYMHEFFTSKS